jgi:opacity protein-like surface antigen
MGLVDQSLMAAALAVGLGSAAIAADGAAPLPGGETRDTIITVSPLFGWDRNKMSVRGARGQVSTESDSAPEGGIFLLVVHKNLVFTDFAFCTEVNNTDVFGNLAFINLYGDRKARLAWNVGAGHLYHKIEPANEVITVNVPMVKAGPFFNIHAWHLTVNPYIGYAWERIETRRADMDNDSYLYGLTVGWRRRMLAATVKYYYQDSRKAVDDFQTLRARAHCMFNDHWGAVVRFDYMEHVTSDDTSVLLGPLYVF